MWKAILLCVFVGLAVGEKVTYRNYKVFRFIPENWKQVTAFKSLEENEGFIFWKPSQAPDIPVELMVDPDKLLKFEELTKTVHLTDFKVIIPDVQELIDMSTPQNQSSSFDFISYHTLDEIYENLDDLAKQYPDNVQVIIGGQTFQGRQIKGVKISFKPNNPGVFIEGGIYAREWITPALAMYMAHQILTSEDPDIRDMAESYDWYIFPSFNPDGYVYTHTTDRMWIRTLARPFFRDCLGINPNKNWDDSWGYFDQCSDKYGGMYSFSEVETRNMAAYIHTIRNKFFAYFSFQTMSGSLFYHEDIEDGKDYLFDIARIGAAALQEKYGFINWSWVHGYSENLNTGDTVSYIKQKYNKQLAFTYQLSDKGQYGFLYPPKEIIPMGEGVLHSVKAMLKAAKNYELVPHK